MAYKMAKLIEELPSQPSQYQIWTAEVKEQDDDEEQFLFSYS